MEEINCCHARAEQLLHVRRVDSRSHLPVDCWPRLVVSMGHLRCNLLLLVVSLSITSAQVSLSSHNISCKLDRECEPNKCIRSQCRVPTMNGQCEHSAHCVGKQKCLEGQCLNALSETFIMVTLYFFYITLAILLPFVCIPLIFICCSSLYVCWYWFRGQDQLIIPNHSYDDDD